MFDNNITIFKKNNNLKIFIFHNTIIYIYIYIYKLFFKNLFSKKLYYMLEKRVFHCTPTPTCTMEITVTKVHFGLCSFFFF
jgi:hypothetical protein